MKKDVFFNKILISFLFILKTNSAFAFSGNWLVGLGGGVAIQNLQNSTTIVPNGSGVPAPYGLDTFTIKNPSAPANIDFSGGYQWQHATSFLPFTSLTLHYEHQFSSKITGAVQEYGLPLFTNYNYSLQLQSDIVDVVGKFDFIQYEFILPYVSVGLGFVSNQLNNYYEQAIPSVYPARISPAYHNKSNLNFTYSLGTGIDFPCSRNNVWLTLGYQFIDLGKINSGAGANTWASTSLSFGKLTSHIISVTGTYLFE